MDGLTRAQEIGNEIEAILLQVRANLEKMTPTQTADYAVRLATLNYDLGEEVVKANHKYYGAWKDLRAVCASAKDSEIESKATSEHEESQRLSRKAEALVEVINALKKKISVVESGLRNQH